MTSRFIDAKLVNIPPTFELLESDLTPPKYTFHRLSLDSLRIKIDILINDCDIFFRGNPDPFSRANFTKSTGDRIITIKESTDVSQLHHVLNDLMGMLVNHTPSFIVSHLNYFRDGLQLAASVVRDEINGSSIGFAAPYFSQLSLTSNRLPELCSIEGKNSLNEDTYARVLTNFLHAKNKVYGFLSKLKDEPSVEKKIFEYRIDVLTTEIGKARPHPSDLECDPNVCDLWNRIVKTLASCRKLYDPSGSMNDEIDLRLTGIPYMLDCLAREDLNIAYLINSYDSDCKLPKRILDNYLEIQKRRLAPEGQSKGLRSVYSLEELHRLSSLPGSKFYELRVNEETLGFAAALSDPNTFPKYTQEVAFKNHSRLGRSIYLVIAATTPEAAARMGKDPYQVLMSAIRQDSATSHFDSIFGWVRSDNPALLSHIVVGGNILTPIVPITDDGHEFKGVFVGMPTRPIPLDKAARPLQKRMARGILRQHE